MGKKNGEDISAIALRFNVRFCKELLSSIVFMDMVVHRISPIAVKFLTKNTTPTLD